MKKVNLKILNGSVSADFTGFIGKSCVSLEERIRIPEMEVDHKELKPEYNFTTNDGFTNTEQNEW